jgi:ketosteroid isomerase-like protein
VSEAPVRIPLRPPPAATRPEGASPEELLALPPGSPDRTAFLVERVVGAAEAFSRGDLDGLLGFYHPDIEILIARLGEGGVWGGDFDESYRGHERLLQLSRQWLEAWDDLRLEPDELFDEGGNTFAMFATWVGRGAGSGVEVTTSYQARQAMVGDRIARVVFWPDRESALRAMGLEA